MDLAPNGRAVRYPFRQDGTAPKKNLTSGPGFSVFQRLIPDHGQILDIQRSVQHIFSIGFYIPYSVQDPQLFYVIENETISSRKLVKKTPGYFSNFIPVRYKS
jgi:hypothetical protein